MKDNKTTIWDVVIIIIAYDMVKLILGAIISHTAMVVTGMLIVLLIISMDETNRNHEE